MKRMALCLLSILSLLAACTSATAQLVQAWQKPAEACVMTKDATGNLYVASREENSAWPNNVVVTKYSPNGDSLWSGAYAAPIIPDDWNRFVTPTAIALDAEGNVYVAGVCQFENDGVCGLPFLVKYSPAGSQVWSDFVFFYDYSIGPNGEIVTGSSNEFNFDPSGEWGIPRQILVGPSGSVYVVGGACQWFAGWSFPPGNPYFYGWEACCGSYFFAIKYSSEGDRDRVSPHCVPGTSGQYGFHRAPYVATLDADENLYAMGGGFNGVSLVKWDTEGNETETYGIGAAESPLEFRPVAFAVDPDGNFIVVGKEWYYDDPYYSVGYHATWIVRKYDKVGNSVWESRLPFAGYEAHDGIFQTATLCVGPQNDVMTSVGLWQPGAVDWWGNALENMATLRLDKSTGAVIWQHVYEGPGECNWTGPWQIACNEFGDCYVLGESFYFDPLLDWQYAGLVLKYGPGGSLLWEFRSEDLPTWELVPGDVGGLYVGDGANVMKLIPLDVIPPTIALPVAVTATESDPLGTPVTLTPPAVSDDYDPSPTLTNDAPALFPLGTTTVTWTAKDASGNTSTAQQLVTVVAGPPANQLGNLDTLFTELTGTGDIQPEVVGSLEGKVSAAMDALARGNPNDVKTAMNELKALVNYVEAQTDKKITPAAAAAIIERANRVINSLGG